MAGETEPHAGDSTTNVLRRGQFNLGRAPAVLVRGDPLVDPPASLRAVHDDAPFAAGLGDGPQWVSKCFEWQVGRERTGQGREGALDIDIFVDRIGEVQCRRMVARSVTGLRVGEGGEVPAIQETIDQSVPIKVVVQQLGPRGQVDVRAWKDDTSPVNIRDTVRPYLDDEIDEVGKKGRAGAGTAAVTRAVLRKGCFGYLGGLGRVDLGHDCFPDFRTGRKIFLHLPPRISRGELKSLGIERCSKMTPDHVTPVFKLNRDLRTVASKQAKLLDLQRGKRGRDDRQRLRRPSGEARWERRVLTGPGEHVRGWRACPERVLQETAVGLGRGGEYSERGGAGWPRNKTRGAGENGSRAGCCRARNSCAGAQGGCATRPEEPAEIAAGPAAAGPR